MHAYPHTAACAAPSTLKHTNHRTFNPTSLPNPLRDTHTHTHTFSHSTITPPPPHSPTPPHQEKFQLERTGNRIAATTAAPVPGSSAAAQPQPQPRAHAAPRSAADAQYEREVRGEREAAARRGVQGATREKVRACLRVSASGLDVWCG